ncbi:hypothetical protein [Streptomyces hydrogenans]|uniref:Uncharacterized protein n=1 Tax=Streptomyces hydrogenans TaxID=1873719 RepID=A0ABQ3PH40_9ACTN|nr:hypothetical protein [Streptomyces hydrogenans]GHG19573.1 hypothetical protein GCM10018784_35940 [Streptomyces hydrogenans]GHI20372.1 hypothetical protein Shyd_17430 [Streptomyces hydrogenans]GHI22690.1 hypothetical protein Shyd_40610 [Streptomyces hydrogenans]GHI24342.1 hypothetical protein Shyd_57130 [Streptomyces hydrogenans]GHI25767.1 hypothetical protein Shyd_71380 [Streptomyces hydrogenans]
MDREDLAAALEQHGTDAACEAALALRAGATFSVWGEAALPASRFLSVWAWRAQCMAEDGIVTRKDFEQGLPALQRLGDAPVAMGRVDATEGTRLIFLSTDLISCVAVL